MLGCLYTYPLKIDLNFRSICMESSEHNLLICNRQIYSNQLNFGKWTVFVLFFLKFSVHVIIISLLLPSVQ